MVEQRAAGREDTGKEFEENTNFLLDHDQPQTHNFKPISILKDHTEIY